MLGLHGLLPHGSRLIHKHQVRDLVQCRLVGFHQLVRKVLRRLALQVLHVAIVVARGCGYRPYVAHLTNHRHDLLEHVLAGPPGGPGTLFDVLR